MTLKKRARKPKRSKKSSPPYVLQMFIRGQIGASRDAVQNLKRVCERDLPGQFKIEVVDISKNPAAAKDYNLVVLPAVVRKLPDPIKKFVGNWCTETGELIGVGLLSDESPKQKRQ